MNLPDKPAMIKRRIIYIDGTVQKRLMIALVTLEILLVGAALWVLYLQLVGTVEANLYRAHAVGKPVVFPLLKAAMLGLGSFLAINILLLWAADRLWARHLETILGPFSALTDKVSTLDFSADTTPDQPHNVVSMALAWRDAERRRLQILREKIRQLDTPAGSSTPADKERRRQALEAMLRQLP